MENIDEPVEINVTKMGESEQEDGWDNNEDNERSDLADGWIPEHLG